VPCQPAIRIRMKWGLLDEFTIAHRSALGCSLMKHSSAIQSQSTYHFSGVCQQRLPALPFLLTAAAAAATSYAASPSPSSSAGRTTGRLPFRTAPRSSTSWAPSPGRRFHVRPHINHPHRRDYMGNESRQLIVRQGRAQRVDTTRSV
jgi:hypothetical protein